MLVICCGTNYPFLFVKPMDLSFNGLKGGSRPRCTLTLNHASLGMRL